MAKRTKYNPSTLKHRWALLNHQMDVLIEALDVCVTSKCLLSQCDTKDELSRVITELGTVEKKLAKYDKAAEQQAKANKQEQISKNHSESAKKQHAKKKAKSK